MKLHYFIDFDGLIPL